MQPTLISSYKGESDYTIGRSRISIRWRAFADDAAACSPGVFDREVMPAVGTLMGSDRFAWPPAEAIAAFPQYVPARFRSSDYQIEYLDNRAPAVAVDRFGHYAIDAVERID